MVDAFGVDGSRGPPECEVPFEEVRLERRGSVIGGRGVGEFLRFAHWEGQRG